MLSAASRASTARAAGGRAVCVALLRACAWSCAERVGGALTRAPPRARTGTQRRAAHARALAPAYTQHTTHSARWCSLVLPSHPRLAWASAGCTRARWWQRCCGAAPLPVAPLDPATPPCACVLCQPCPGATPPPHGHMLVPAPSSARESGRLYRVKYRTQPVHCIGRISLCTKKLI